MQDFKRLWEADDLKCHFQCLFFCLKGQGLDGPSGRFLHFGSPKQLKIELEQIFANHHEEYVFTSFKSFLEDLRGQEYFSHNPLTLFIIH